MGDSTGSPTLGGDVEIDVDRLIVSRLLVQANSGGGKSWALRRLLEQTFGACQHIVLDPEGEFHTLRERYDYVLVGKGGEAAASVDTAAMLALRLLELGTSAIIDISELGVERVAFVTRFIEALMSAPREMWHPVLVVVDEAHRYCPQGVTPRRPAQRDDDDPLTEMDSAAAVISLMDSGRKRGFCGVLATQRISKLSKDASAECNNKLIGRCVEIDAKRAGDELGLTAKNAIEQLRKLRAGQFFVFGPALSDDVRLATIGEVHTTHPEAGKATPPPTPPRDRIRQVLGKLADLPKQADEEKTSTQRLRARVAELERQLKASVAIETVERVVEKTVEVPVLSDAQLVRLKQLIADARPVMYAAERFVEVAEQLGIVIKDIEATIQLAGQLPPKPASNGARPRGLSFEELPADAQRAVERSLARPAPRNAVRGSGPGDSSLAGGERKILTALAQYSAGRTKQQVAILTGYAHNGGGFSNYVSALRTKGYIEGDSSLLRITAAGSKALGSYQPLPSGRALFEHWLGQLGKAEREILRALYEDWPTARPKEYVAVKAGYAADGGGFNNALSRLRTLELIEGKAKLKASDQLQDGAS